MNGNSQTFAAVDDVFLDQCIRKARSRVVYIAPGIGRLTALAITAAMKDPGVTLTLILDSDDDAYRIGYGDAKALQILHDATSKFQVPLRRQAGIRLGVLIYDDKLLIWAPTAQSVEPERQGDQPNGIALSGSAIESVIAAAGADGSDVLPAQAEIGQHPLTIKDLDKMVESLRVNEPAPFDLSQRTRVFSTRFQYIEYEVRGAEWTEKKIKLSTILLNPDLPEDLADVLETRIRPFQAAADVAIEVPQFMNGEAIYRRDGTRMTGPATQTDMNKYWVTIRGRYLRHVKGFGWLIRKEDLDSFRKAVATYEESLKAWVTGFLERVREDEDKLVASIVALIRARLQQAPENIQLNDIDLEAAVKAGFERLRVINPGVRIVLKNVSWESSRDDEFNAALRDAFSATELEGWFDEYTAARQIQRQK